MKSTALLLASALCLTACATAEEREAVALAKAEEIAAKRGEEVNRLCFTQNINGWRAVDDDAVVVTKGVNDKFLLELAGPCDAENAFLSIGLKTFGGSSCLSRGDRLVTDERIANRCRITKIYEWNEDAEPSSADDSEAMMEMGKEGAG